ncbi:MAG: DUF6569 family protein [candidate division WOR-3 bacterium]
MKRIEKALAFGLALAGVALAQSEAVTRLAGTLSVGQPFTHENLTIFPLTGSGSATTSLSTLDEAIKAGRVKVSEKDGGEVNTIRMRNSGKSYVYGIAGEIVSGAKQDRMLKNDVLLPPESGWLEVPVYCTEHGRWHGASHDFSSKGYVAAGRVRSAAAKTESQSDVWAEVGAARDAVGAGGETEAFARVFEQEDIQARAKPYEQKFKQLVQTCPDAQGVLVAVGSKVICVDVFGSKGLFRKMWPKLLRSYVVDAISQTGSGRLTIEQARQFIRGLTQAKTTTEPSVGAGQLLRVNTPGASGSALVFRSAVVHLDLFPDGGFWQIDDTDDFTPRLDIRRQNSRD